MKKITILILLLLATTFLFAVNAPDLRCLQVNENGDVTLHWLQPSDMSGFVEYRIMCSTAQFGPFTQVGTVTSAAATDFFHSGAGANTQPAYYQVVTVGTNGSFASQTVGVMDFYLTNMGNGVAVLNWTPPATPVLPTYATAYTIARENPEGTWRFRANTTATTFNDTIDLCDAQLGFRIELTDASGCRNISRVNRDRFNDRVPPPIPHLDSVSVQPAGTILLGWQPSPAQDAAAYIIYYNDGDIWIPVDTVFGIENTQWTDNQHDAGAEVHHYRIATLDDCMNASPMSALQQTMQLQSSYDGCTGEVTLSWTAYVNMRDHAKYVVFYAQDGGNQQFAGETDAQTTSLVVPNVAPGSRYCFVVRAVNQQGDITASSTESCFSFTPEESNEMVYIRSVSVVDNDHLEITVFTGESEHFQRVQLYKSVDSVGNFEHFATLTNNGNDTYVFTDLAATKVDRKTYFYQATIDNECGFEGVKSNISHNIVLRGKSENWKNFLTWTSYGTWSGGVDEYVVQRRDGVHTSFTDLRGVGAQVADYQDNVINLPDVGDRFIYRIVARENGAGNAYGLADESVSNELVLLQPPIVYIPNAFRPKHGVTKIFKPETSFVTVSDYLFVIYSRKGDLVFSTTNPEEGWDGLDDGKFYQSGVYVWKIRFSYGKDDLYERAGTVTVFN